MENTATAFQLCAWTSRVIHCWHQCDTLSGGLRLSVSRYRAINLLFTQSCLKGGNTKRTDQPCSISVCRHHALIHLILSLLRRLKMKAVDDSTGTLQPHAHKDKDRARARKKDEKACKSGSKQLLGDPLKTTRCLMFRANVVTRDYHETIFFSA